MVSDGIAVPRTLTHPFFAQGFGRQADLGGTDKIPVVTAEKRRLNPLGRADTGPRPQTEDAQRPIRGSHSEEYKRKCVGPTRRNSG